MSLEDTWQYQHSLKMRPACDRIIEHVFHVPPERIERFGPGHPLSILDRNFAIDMRIQLPNGSHLTGQEKALTFPCYKFRTFTMEFYQNRHTREPGEFFHIASQFYLHGYADQSGEHFIEWKIINILPFMAWLKNNTLEWFASKIRDDRESRAAFFYFPYDDIPQEFYFASWKRCENKP
jgi:hypothetical protein